VTAPTRERSERQAALAQFASLVDEAHAWLEPHMAQLILHAAISDLRSRIGKEERDALVLRALRAAHKNLPEGAPERATVGLAISRLTDEGSI